MDSGTNKTVLITGINGFIGSHLAKQLSKDYKIVGLQYQKYKSYRLAEFNFKIYESKHNFLKKIFTENKIFATIHAATVYKTGDEPLSKLLDTNILLPVKLYELSNQFAAKLFINTDSFFNQPNTGYNYLSEYTLSKKHVLEWLQASQGKCKLINMKLFHVYGPYDSSSKFVPYIISSLKNNLPYLDLTPGKQKRDFIYIDDVVNAYKLILNKAQLLNNDYYEYEVGRGESIAIRDFIKLTKDITKSCTELNFGKIPYRKNEIMDEKANNDPLKHLGWESKTDIRTGIQKILFEY